MYFRFDLILYIYFKYLHALKYSYIIDIHVYIYIYIIIIYEDILYKEKESDGVTNITKPQRAGHLHLFSGGA